MLAFQDRKYRSLADLVYEGDYDAAIPHLEDYWAKYPNDHDVFSLLEQCYSGKEDWNAYESLLLQIAAAHAHTYRLAYFQMKLHLAKGLPDKAITILNTCMDAFKQAQLDGVDDRNPSDFINLDENISEIGILFKRYGFVDVFIEYLSGLGQTSEISGPILLARYYAYVDQNKERALQTIKQALLAFPNDELLYYTLSEYKDELRKAQQLAAQRHLSNHQPAQAIGLNLSILKETPGALVAQEYYLVAVVCKLFTPFLVFFSKHNWIGMLPPVGKAFLHAMFFFVCSFYYKGRKAPIEHDVLEAIVWVGAALTIARFLLFPFVLQIVAFFKWPSYHLLKRPIRFYQGVLILMAWVHVLWAYEQAPEKLSFRLFLTTGFLFHAFILEFANGQPWVKQAAYLTYISLSLSLGTLAYFNIISEAWIGLLLVGWMLPILFNALIDWVQNLKIDKTAHSHITDPEVRKNERYTRRIDVGAQIILGIGILSFLAVKLVPPSWESVHLFMTFGVLLTAIVFIIMAGKNEPDLITLSKSRPIFSVLLAILFVGMNCCLYLSSFCGNYPIRKGGICVYSFIGIFVFPMLALIVHWLYYRNWKPSKTIS